MHAIPSAIAALLLFSLLPAVSAGGAKGIPLLLCVAAVLALRPSRVVQVFEKAAIPIWLLLLFTSWAIATSFWSVQPGQQQAMKLAILVPLGLMFAVAAAAEPTRRLTRAAGIAAFAILFVLVLVEALWDLPINRAANPDMPPSEVIRNVNRAAAVLLALTFPTAAAFIADDRPNLARAIFAAGALIAIPLDLWANLLAFGIGLVAFGIAFRAPRFAVMSVSTVLAAWLVAAPFATPLLISNQRIVDALPTSWAHRAAIWEYVCAKIMEAPLLGRGLDSARAVTDRITFEGVDMRAVPLHPHSGSLQIWYELGAVGAGLGALTLLVGGWAVAHFFKNNRIGAAAAAGTLASLGIIANLSFGFWQEWWTATMFIAAALVGALTLRRA